MAPNTYTWISAWFLLTTPVVIWDAFYCLMRYATYNIETDYVCQDRGLKYGYDQGRARWPEVTCTGSGSRMKFTRRLIMYAESP